MNKIAICLMQREDLQKNCGADFLHQECTSGDSIMVRRNIPKDELTIFRQIIQITSVPNNNFLLRWTHSVFGGKQQQQQKNMYRM